MKSRRALLTMMLLAFLAGTPIGLIAHDGHGVTPASNALHYITEWVHGAPVLVLAAILVIAMVYMARRSARIKN